jgi:hypothetical protein
MTNDLGGFQTVSLAIDNRMPSLIDSLCGVNQHLLSWNGVLVGVGLGEEKKTHPTGHPMWYRLEKEEKKKKRPATRRKGCHWGLGGL